MDSNKDGVLSSKEWGNGVAKHKDVIAKFFGGATIEEIGRQFARIDADSNKELSWDEMLAAAGIEAWRHDARLGVCDLRARRGESVLSSWRRRLHQERRACSPHAPRRAARSAMRRGREERPCGRRPQMELQAESRRLQPCIDFATHRGFPFLCRRRRRLVLADDLLDDGFDLLPPRLERTRREPELRLDLLAQHLR